MENVSHKAGFIFEENETIQGHYFNLKTPK